MLQTGRQTHKQTGKRAYKGCKQVNRSTINKYGLNGRMLRKATGTLPIRLTTGWIEEQYTGVKNGVRWKYRCAQTEGGIKEDSRTLKGWYGGRKAGMNLGFGTHRYRWRWASR